MRDIATVDDMYPGAVYSDALGRLFVISKDLKIYFISPDGVYFVEDSNAVVFPLSYVVGPSSWVTLYTLDRLSKNG
jgi:hypothetical protein